MSLEDHQREALRMLEGIGQGTMTTEDSLALVEDGDPALVYLILTWLRKRYLDLDNSEAVLERLLKITSRPSVVTKMKEGQADPVVQWFEESYSYRKLEATEFVELIVEKLEG